MSKTEWHIRLKDTMRAAALNATGDHFDINVSVLEELCKSPIELALGYAMAAADWAHWEDMPAPRFVECDEEFSWDSITFSGWLTAAVIRPQMPVCNYRIDFAVALFGIRIAVECDGHDFHERTKQQAANDRLRDRVLQGEGWLVARFTGAEIYKDAADCVKQIRSMAVQEFIRRSQASYMNMAESGK